MIEKIKSRLKKLGFHYKWKSWLEGEKSMKMSTAASYVTIIHFLFTTMNMNILTCF